LTLPSLRWFFIPLHNVVRLHTINIKTLKNSLQYFTCFPMLCSTCVGSPQSTSFDDKFFPLIIPRLLLIFVTNWCHFSVWWPGLATYHKDGRDEEPQRWGVTDEREEMRGKRSTVQSFSGKRSTVIFLIFSFFTFHLSHILQESQFSITKLFNFYRYI